MLQISQIVICSVTLISAIIVQQHGQVASAVHALALKKTVTVLAFPGL